MNTIFNWLPHIVFVILIACTLYGVRYYLKHIKSAHESLHKLAARLNLTLHNNDPSAHYTLEGDFRGIPILICEDIRQHGRGTHYFTSYYVTIPGDNIPTGLHVSQRPLFSILDKFQNDESCLLGDPELDKAFIVKANSCHEAQQFFANPDVRHYFLELIQPDEAFRFERNTLILDFARSMLNEHKFIRARLEVLTRCAHAVAGTDHRTHTQQTLPPASHPVVLDPQTELQDTDVSW